MRLAEVLICEVQRDRSLKILKHFTERIGEACEPPASRPAIKSTLVIQARLERGLIESNESLVRIPVRPLHCDFARLDLGVLRVVPGGTLKAVRPDQLRRVPVHRRIGARYARC